MLLGQGMQFAGNAFSGYQQGKMMDQRLEDKNENIGSLLWSEPYESKYTG